MFQKERLIRIAITMYLLSFLCLFIDFELNRKTIVALTIGGFATLASIIAIFIPTRYTFYFAKETWLRSDKGDYFITILYTNHEQSKSPQTSVYIETENRKFELIKVAVEHDEEGNVTISVNNIFKGKAILIG